MYPRLLLIVLFFLASCQSRKTETQTTADTTTVAMDTTSSAEPEIPIEQREDEQIISFSEFHSKYIKTKQLGLLRLPITFDNTYSSGIGTYDSPEGAFESIPKRNSQVQVVGLLPDTSRYYGIVYALNLMRPTTYAPSGYYSLRLATFSRDGKLIAKAEIISDTNFDGASSCGEAENVQQGFIDAHLNFYGTHVLIQDCEGEGQGRLRPVLLHEMNYGQVSEDGTISMKNEQREDQGDDNTPPFIGYANADLTATLTRAKTSSNLQANDLLVFFPDQDLRSPTEYWAWYSLRYPVENRSLVAAVRRIKTIDPDVRKRQYGVVVVTDNQMSKPYNFYFEDNPIEENNEPAMQLLYDHMLIVTTETPQGKSSELGITLVPFGNGDFTVSIDQLSKPELEFERNWIFAHNGLKFDSPQLLAQFSKYDWYKPTINDLPKDQLPYFDRLAVEEIEQRLK